MQVLHTASNGGCRIVVGRTRADGSVGVVADVGHSIFADSSAAAAVAEGAQAHVRGPEGERDELLGEMRYATIRLRAGVDAVIIGSEGLWCAAWRQSNSPHGMACSGGPDCLHAQGVEADARIRMHVPGP